MPRSELRWMLLLFAIPFVILVSIPVRRLINDRETTRLIEVVKRGEDSNSGSVAEARRALKYGADPNATVEGKTPLIRYAARKIDMKIVGVLQENGAKIDDETQKAIDKARIQQHVDDLCEAIENGNNTIFNRLLNGGVDVNGTSTKGKFPLQVAIESNEKIGVGMALGLINKGAKVRRKTADQGKLEMIQLTLLYGGDTTLLSALQKAGAPTSPESALMIATIKNDLSGVQKWLDSGVKVDAKPSPEEWTPLQWAASSGFDRLVEFLLKKGADPLKTATETDSGTPETSRQIAESFKSNASPNQEKAYDRTIAILERAEKSRRHSLTVGKTPKPVNSAN